ncbi:MAG: MBL fold metallo-hydrolase [Abditibacteriota bacterium]|nr:MBL fold metallo-hydrolase [Abditibacteriota bacterium]
MEILYIAHSSFLVTAKNGAKILFDPYDPEGYGDSLKYVPYCGEADAVCVSHSHPDHRCLKFVQGNPTVFDKPGSYTFGDIKIKGIETDHDENGGAQRGKSIVFVLEIEGMTLAHLGDLGRKLTPAELKEIGKTDIVLVPVGGYFTIDAATAEEVVADLGAKVIIPMHFSTPWCSFPIGPVEDFTNRILNVVRLGVTRFEPTDIPASPSVLVLEPSHVLK